MKISLVISLLLASPSGAFAADDAQCDAKPFTLNKPKPAAQQPASTATAEAVKAKTAAPKATPKANANRTRPKPIADCKEPKKG
jgi:hypothetical protein